MMISVAICTYNGAPFIKEQIDSIVNQSVCVDEIVVCDDGSTDETVSIVRKCAERTSIPFRIIVNQINKGVSKNFEDAIYSCLGDIIFLSDQDDIWEPSRVQETIAYFDAHPKVSVVFTDASLVDENGRDIIEYSLWDCVGFDKRLKRFFDDHFELETFFLNKSTGATMAIRKDVMFPFSKYCDNQLIYHDYCLCLKAIDNNGLGYIDKPLIKYRTHRNQKSGIKFPYQEPRVYYHQYRLINIVPIDFPFENTKVKDHLKYYNERVSFKAIDCFRNFFLYLKIYHKWGINYFLYDLIVKMKKIKMF